MVDGANNFIQVFNELVILLCTWYLFLWTDYVPNPEDRYNFGAQFLYIIGFNFVVNIAFLV